jgi:molecular chaperone GrpE
MMPREPEEQNNNESLPAEITAEGTANLETELAEAKKKAEEYLASWQRSQADFTNYRRRAEQEKQDLGKYANAALFCDILPVLDDLERALNAIPEEYTDSDWVKGVRLVERKFRNILERQGVKPICALGMAFDPNLHEAIRQEKGPEGTVISEVEKGYTLGDKLLRPARVIVGSGEEEGEPETPEDRTPG